MAKSSLLLPQCIKITKLLLLTEAVELKLATLKDRIGFNWPWLKITKIWNKMISHSGAIWSNTAAKHFEVPLISSVLTAAWMTFTFLSATCPFKSWLFRFRKWQSSYHFSLIVSFFITNSNPISHCWSLNVSVKLFFSRRIRGTSTSAQKPGTGLQKCDLSVCLASRKIYWLQDRQWESPILLDVSIWNCSFLADRPESVIDALTKDELCVGCSLWNIDRVGQKVVTEMNKIVKNESKN